MINLIYNITQPFAVICFIIAGICCLLLGYIHKGVLNIAFAVVNFIVFYGSKFLK